MSKEKTVTNFKVLGSDEIVNLDTGCVCTDYDTKVEYKSHDHLIMTCSNCNKKTETRRKTLITQQKGY